MECSRCVLPSTYPNISFDEYGVCNYCKEFVEKRYDNNTFSSEKELIAALQNYRPGNNGYDLLVCLSGGVDSSIAMMSIVKKFGMKPLAFHFDNGFEISTAQNNVKRLCRHLDVDLVIWQHEQKFLHKMLKALHESDVKDLSGCYFCGNLLYINSIDIAQKLRIPLVINGYSKGQAAMIYNDERSSQLLKKMVRVVESTGDMALICKFSEKFDVLGKHKLYQQKSDLCVENETDDRVMVIPFNVFNFYKEDKSNLQDICQSEFGWTPIAQSYPSRTTNCAMVWLNCYMDFQICAFPGEAAHGLKVKQVGIIISGRGLKSKI